MKKIVIGYDAKRIVRNATGLGSYSRTLVNDLAKAGDELAVTHYRTLEKNADDCIKCGHCDSRCPFHVHQSARMSDIAEWFAKK